MAPIDVVQAQAEQATRRQGLVTAENARRTAELAAEAPDRLRHGGSELGGHARPGGSPGFPGRTDRHRSGDSGRAQPADRSRNRQEERREQHHHAQLPAQPDAADRRPAGELRRAGRRRPVSAALEQQRRSAARSPRPIPGGIGAGALVAVRQPVSALDGSGQHDLSAGPQLAGRGGRAGARAAEPDSSADAADGAAGRERRDQRRDPGAQHRRSRSRRPRRRASCRSGGSRPSRASSKSACRRTTSSSRRSAI